MNEVEATAANQDNFKQNRHIKLKSQDISNTCDKITTSKQPAKEVKQVSELPNKANSKMLNRFSTNMLYFRGSI